MKKYLKENIKNLPFILVAFIMFYGITTLATNYLFNSNEVSYDNTETGLHADKVQGAIDEVFQHATDYSELKTKIGTSTLTTTAQTLIGGVNELKTSVTSLNDQIVSRAAASGGTALSMVTTGEKYTWNSKVKRKSGTIGTISVGANSNAIIPFSLPSETGYSLGSISFIVNHDLCYVTYNYEGKLNIRNFHSASQSVTVTYSAVFVKD